MNEWTLDNTYFYKSKRVKRVKDKNDSQVEIGDEVMNGEVWLALKILNASVGNFAKLVIIKVNKNSNPTLN